MFVYNKKCIEEVRLYKLFTHNSLRKIRLADHPNISFDSTLFKEDIKCIDKYDSNDMVTTNEFIIIIALALALGMIVIEIILITENKNIEV